VDVTLPKSGLWNFAAFFVYQNGADLREGSGGDYVTVLTGGVPPNSPPLFDFNVTTKSFMEYPLPDDQLFDTPIDIRTNLNPMGYTVTMTIGTGNSTSAPDNITAGCQPVFFSILDKNGLPIKNMVPFLDAPAHIVFAAQYDTIYHVHAMYLESYLNFNRDVLGMLKQMNLTTQQMKNLPFSSMLIIMMGAQMIGVNNDGTFNCLNDEAVAMRNMGMDFNTFYGNNPFGSNLITLFDFPQQGSWRVFVSFAVLEGNSTFLVSADFALEVPNPPKFTYVIPTPPTRTATVASSAKLSTVAGSSVPQPSGGSRLDTILAFAIAALVLALFQ